jgi:hypothetical protein
MKPVLFSFALLILTLATKGQPVFKNPGIPDSESFEITDFIDNTIGFVTSKIDISLQERNGQKSYHIHVEEGNLFLNDIDVNYYDLTTITEKRINKKDGSVEELYENLGNGIIHFYNKEKGIDKKFENRDKNIYSRYAYFISFRGFPFERTESVRFSTYMFEYGDALPMKVTVTSKQMISTKVGIFECYKLELSVAGWLSLFAPFKSYLYFTVDGTHRFVRYQEKADNGGWNNDELIKID